jgi:hypothetical protein
METRLTRCWLWVGPTGVMGRKKFAQRTRFAVGFIGLLRNKDKY